MVRLLLAEVYGMCVCACVFMCVSGCVCVCVGASMFGVCVLCEYVCACMFDARVCFFNVFA